jgi:hypothetical protein
MLSNERFALECLQRYAESGDIVDATNGQFAHCPQPERYGDKGYYLTWEDHQHQGLLQSRDIGECCFFAGDAKKWLLECDPIPESYFELWDIYEEYSGDNLRKLHAEKDENGKSFHSLELNRKLHQERDENGKSLHGIEAGKRLHARKDENGKSLHALEMNKRLHAKRDENGKSLHSLEMIKKLHSKKDENGKSLHTLKLNKKLHSKKDELGRSIIAMKSASQIWESTVDGFRSNAGVVAQHNRRNGWDPDARVRIS